MIVDTTWWSSSDWQRYEALAGVTRSREQELREATWSTRVVDLSAPVPILRANLRKSYRGLIRHADRAYRIEVCDAADMDAFRQLHAIDAGRETRPRSTWELMADWVRDGRLLLIGARETSQAQARSEWLGFVGVYRWNRWSYYGHSATLRPNIAAALVWHGMLEAKTLGAQYFEVGWQNHDLSDKGKRLDFFRSGFGGTDWPLTGDYAHAR